MVKKQKYQKQKQKQYQVVNIKIGDTTTKRKKRKTKSKGGGGGGGSSNRISGANTTSIVNNNNVYPNTFNPQEERLMKRQELFNTMNNLQGVPISNPVAQQLSNHELTNYRIGKPNPNYYDRDITQRINEPLPNKTKSVFDRIKGGLGSSYGVVKDSAKIMGVAGLATLGGMAAKHLAGGGVRGEVAQNATAGLINSRLGGGGEQEPAVAPVIAEGKPKSNRYDQLIEAGYSPQDIERYGGETFVNLPTPRQEAIIQGDLRDSMTQIAQSQNRPELARAIQRGSQTLQKQGIMDFQTPSIRQPVAPPQQSNLPAFRPVPRISGFQQLIDNTQQGLSQLPQDSQLRGSIWEMGKPQEDIQAKK